MQTERERTADAEVGVIGSILLQPECLPDVREYVTAADFESEVYRIVFQAACEMWDEMRTVDLILLRERLTGRFDRGQINDLLIGCMEMTPTAANAIEYAVIVRNNGKVKEIRRIGWDMQGVDSFSRGWEEATADYIQRLENLQDSDAHTDLVGGRNWGEQFLRWEEDVLRDPKAAFVQTGISSLDSALGSGMVRGGLYVVGARPGMGKTTLAINIAEEVAAHGLPTLFVSLEMSEEQIMCKRLSRETGIPYRDFVTGQMAQDDVEIMREMLPEVASRPMSINTKAGLTVADINLLIQKTRGCQFVVIDYLGLLHPSHSSNNRYEDYTNISGELKQLAKKLKIPILVLSQLNRQNTARTDKRPQLSDLRETGAVEQDADAVILLHREDYYKRDSGEAAPDSEDIELIIAKNRHGNTGTVKMKWAGACGRISGIDYAHNDEDEWGVL